MAIPCRTGLWLAALASVLCAGCTMGPAVMRVNRTQYNIALQETANEQLLLNIVRLRYREPMSFLELNAINTVFKFGLTGGFSSTEPLHVLPKGNGVAGGSRTHNLGASYSEEPNFSYTPVQGEQFAKRVVSDVDPATLGLLLRSGWPIDRVLRLLAQRLGGLANEPTLPCEAGQTLPPHEKFLQVTRLWRKLQWDDKLHIQVKSEDEVVCTIAPEKLDTATVLLASRENYRFEKNDAGQIEMRKPGLQAVVLEMDWQADETHQALKLLGIQSDKSQPARKIRLVKGADKKEPKEKFIDVPVHIRSFVNVLFYLAQGVEVPPEDIRAKRVKNYSRPDKPDFDRRACTQDLLDVRTSVLPPIGAAVSVFYRGRWFYIPDDQCDSKDGFALLGYIFAIQAGETKGAPPTLVLPIGR